MTSVARPQNGRAKRLPRVTPAEPDPPQPPAGREGFYQGELAEWMEPGCADAPGVFSIYEETGADPGRLVATITVNPELDDRSARKIAVLMSHAPLLWRMLREVATSELNTVDGCPYFARAYELLWEAAGRRPYAWPEPDSDEDVERRGMERMGWKTAKRTP